MRGISYILVDLDGTLIDMDEGAFIAAYFEKLKEFLSDQIKNVNIVEAIMNSVEEISKNPDGVTNNYIRFIKVFSERTKLDPEFMKRKFEEFYRKIFPDLKIFAKPKEAIVEKLRFYRKLGTGLVLATNPVFPKIAVLERLNWSKMKADEFVLITYMENSKYCKPDPRYFLEICEKLNVETDQCLMIGNDAFFDASCEKIGIKYIEVTDFVKR